MTQRMLDGLTANVTVNADGHVVVPALLLDGPEGHAVRSLPGATTDNGTVTVDTSRSVYAFPVLADALLDRHAHLLPDNLHSRLAAAHERFTTAIGASTTVEVPADAAALLDNVLPPKAASTMRPYQKAAVHYVLHRAGKRAFLGDDPGAGKTLVSLSCVWAASLARPCLIVCKSSLKTNWEDEIAKWLPEGQQVVVLSGTTNTGIPDGTQWVIVNYEILHQRLPDILEAAPKAMIVDESQMLKTPADPPKPASGKIKAATDDEVLTWVSMTPAEQREHKNLKPKNVGAWRTWAARHLAKQDAMDMVLLLSATPAPNGKHYEWLSQIDVLGRLEELGGRDHFVERYARWCKECDQLNTRTCTHKTWPTRFKRENNEGSINSAELAGFLRARMMVRRSQRQMFPQLPPINPVTIRLPMDATGRKEYLRVEAEFVDWLKEHAAKKAFAAGENPGRAVARATAAAEGEFEKLMQLSYLRQAAARAKMKACIDWLSDFVADSQEDGNPRKIVLFAWHKEIQQAAIDAIGAWYDSPDGRHHRDRLQRRYETDPRLARFEGKYPEVPRILAATEQSGDQIRTDKRRFQELPEEPFIVCSIAAAAEGHTLDAAETVGWLELPLSNPAQWRQGIGRCYGRASTVHGAMSVQLIAHDPSGKVETIEEKMYRRLEARLLHMANTLDDGRLLEWGDTQHVGGPANAEELVGDIFTDYL